MPRPTRKSIEQHYTAGQAADLLAVDESTIWRWIRSQRITPVFRLSGRAVRIPASAINHMLARSPYAG